MPFDWSINPYRGCAHGCSFCYARAFQSFIGMGAEDEFQNHILIKENAAEGLDELFRAAKDDHRAAMVSLLRLSTEVKAWYYQTLRTHYPHLIPAYL